ncbi:MAG: ABC transporter ATP-binding protein [Thermodesulfobacteriota bacterium]
MSNAIEVQNLWKTFRIPHEKKNSVFETITGVFRKSEYEEFIALKNIDFSVNEGEFVGIIGANGSGKSTLLGIISNILRPTKGSVKVNGKITSFLELGVGFHPEMTAKENIYMYGAFMGLSDREIDDRISEIFEFSGLRKFKDTKLKKFSSGMQVRLAFSTAIQTSPEILLVDEVLAVGDMEFKQKCFDKFNEFRRSGVTILFVTHDLGAVRRFCDKTLLLRSGEQVAFGNTGEIIDKYVYAADKKIDEPIIEVPEKKEPEEEPEEKSEEKKTRWGDKRVVITDVKFFDKFGNENRKFNSRDPMKIKIYYKATAIVKNPIFGIAIYSENDVLCYGTNTYLKDFTIDSIAGDGYIDLDIKKLNMLEGKYLLTVAVHSLEHTYDWLDKQFSFNVIKSGQDDGLFDIPCRWKVKE